MNANNQLSNKKLFEELRSLKLKTGHYAVTASGPLGVRGLRTMGDIDVLLSDSYWKELMGTHQPFVEDGFLKVRLSTNVEAVYSGSFGKSIPGCPTVAKQIEQAEIIDGLPFVSIKHVKFFKQKSTRNKDQIDLDLIRQWEASSRRD